MESRCSPETRDMVSSGFMGKSFPDSMFGGQKESHSPNGTMFSSQETMPHICLIQLYPSIHPQKRYSVPCIHMSSA